MISKQSSCSTAWRIRFVDIYKVAKGDYHTLEENVWTRDVRILKQGEMEKAALCQTLGPQSESFPYQWWWQVGLGSWGRDWNQKEHWCSSTEGQAWSQVTTGTELVFQIFLLAGMALCRGLRCQGVQLFPFRARGTCSVLGRDPCAPPNSPAPPWVPLGAWDSLRTQWVLFQLWAEEKLGDSAEP